MPSKENIYGLLSPKKLNPNIIAIGIILVILTTILVYSGRHNKITVTKTVSIETNIPQPSTDTSKHK
jgi:hypothetical protein